MEIREVTNKDNWEDFLKDCYPKTFLQSWNWGEFSKLMGQKLWRLGAYDNYGLIATALVVKVVAKRGTFLMVEHGPNIKPKAKVQSPKILEILLSELKKTGRQENAGFIRFCPAREGSDENKKVFKELGFRKAPMHVHPEISWVLALDKPEEELLMDMRKTTRYLIRQGLRNSEIEIIKSRDIKDIDVFSRLMEETVARHQFHSFSLKYLKNEFRAFIDDNQILILLGKYKGEVIAGAVVVYWQGFGFYHQGASLDKYPKIPVSYLLQWEAIKEAKKRGCRYYSFWGIAPEDKPNHPWKGLTLFKKGFGGGKEEYVKTQDYVLSQRYWLNYVIETIRRIKRGFN